MDVLLDALKEYKLYFGVGVVIAGLIWGYLRFRGKGSIAQSQKSGDGSVNVQVGRDLNMGRKDSTKGKK